MKIGNILLICLASILLISGCSTEASVKVSDQLTAPYITDTDHQREDDTALEDKIKQLLADQVPGNKVKAMVLNYDVLLVGQVATNADKDKVANIVKGLPSPKKVFNYINVASKPVLNTSSTITTEAMTRLETQNNINGNSMKAITVDNIVYLMGTNIGDLSALNTAIEGIYSIPGVKKIVNLVQPGDRDYYSSPLPTPQG